MRTLRLTMNKIMEFAIFNKEISRRITAFTTLMVSLLVGFVVFFFLLPIAVQFEVIFLAVIAAVALVSRWSLIRFFNNYKQVKIRLDDQNLTRISPTSREQIPYPKIRGIHIRRTTRNDIREIKILSQSNHAMYLNAIEGLDKLEGELVQRCGQGVKVSESKEHIDYDHPFFYAILGFVVSFSSVELINILLSMGDKVVGFMIIITTILCLSIGVYILITQPLAKNYGRKSKTSDYIMGLILIAAGLITTWLSS